MRRSALGAVAIVIIALSGCSGPGASSPGSGDDLPTASTSASGAPVASSSIAAAPVTPVAPPTVFSGPGGRSGVTVPITKPAGATVVVATITGGAPGYFFGVSALDGSKEILVGTQGVYTGSTLLDAAGGRTTLLHVFSRAPWTITLSDPRSAQLFTGSFRGAGDTVGVYQGNGGTATITGGTVGTILNVVAYGAGRLAGPLFYGSGGASHAFHWPSGVALVKIRAVGPWSIAIT